MTVELQGFKQRYGRESETIEKIRMHKEEINSEKENYILDCNVSVVCDKVLSLKQLIQIELRISVLNENEHKGRLVKK